MKLHFDPVTQNPPTLVETKILRALREEQGALNPIMTIQRVALYDGEVPLQPAQFVPGTARLVQQLISRSRTEEHDLAEVVLGVPASFRGKGARHLREAARLGAFGKKDAYDKIHLYPEPLAAARSYMQISKGNVLVLDYGGGTLDITVMQIDDPGIFDQEKIHFDGFPEGGSAMDRRLLDYCLSKSREGRVAEWFRKQPLAVKMRIKRNVEKAKIRLSTQETANVELPNSGIGAISLDIQDMCFALQPIMTRMATKVTQVVMKAVGKLENINFVVMSGGASLNGEVQRTVFAMFQHLEKEQFIIPDARDKGSVETCMCAVARGLALLRRDGFAPLIVDSLP
jgi:molecular chaperone DnaK (HSP70)